MHRCFCCRFEDRDDDVSPIHWLIQIWRAFYFFLTNNCCFIILLLFCINITNKSTWCSGKANVHYPSGPGFESQVPHFLNIFSFQVIVCTLQLAVYHTPSCIQETDGQRPDLMARDWKTTKALVNACILDQRSQKRPAHIGPRICY